MDALISGKKFPVYNILCCSSANLFLIIIFRCFPFTSSFVFVSLILTITSKPFTQLTDNMIKSFHYSSE